MTAVFIFYFIFCSPFLEHMLPRFTASERVSGLCFGSRLTTIDIARAFYCLKFLKTEGQNLFTEKT